MDEYRNDFTEDDFDDEDFAAIDYLIAKINYGLELSEDKTTVKMIDPMCIQALKFSLAAIKRAMGDDKAVTYTCKQDELVPEIGVVIVEGADIGVVDGEWFARAAEFASNTEVYPRAVNKVRLTFTFHNLLKTISESAE